MDETRDTELGWELETLVEPDHGPEYWRDVRLHVTEASATRRPGMGGRLRAALARRPLRLALAAVALAAVAGAVLLAGLPRTSGPQSVSAGEVLQRALGAYSSGTTWQSDLLVKTYASGMWVLTPRYDTSLYRFVRHADGSYRVTVFTGEAEDSRVSDIVAYDARTGELRERSAAGRYRVVTRFPLGPPDIPSAALSQVDLGAVLRAVSASGRLVLDETVVGGRPAWTVTCTKGDMAGLPRTDVDWPVYTIAVDKQTWLPVRYQVVVGGILMLDVRDRGVHVDGSIPKGTFRPRPALGDTVRRGDRGFERLTLDDAAAVPGVDALVPGFVPDGYGLRGVAVAPSSISDNRVVKARHVFAVLYASGFDTLTVSTRRIHDPYYEADADPFENRADPGWSELARTETTIRSGAFVGARAKIVVATDTSTPHLWAVKDGVLLTIAGGATARELLAVAESLQPYTAPAASPTD